jgi:hypothetical protein
LYDAIKGNRRAAIRQFVEYWFEGDYNHDLSLVLEKDLPAGKAIETAAEGQASQVVQKLRSAKIIPEEDGTDYKGLLELGVHYGANTWKAQYQTRTQKERTRAPFRLRNTPYA